MTGSHEVAGSSPASSINNPSPGASICSAPARIVASRSHWASATGLPRWYPCPWCTHFAQLRCCGFVAHILGHGWQIHAVGDVQHGLDHEPVETV